MEINVIDIGDPRYYKQNLNDLKNRGKNPIVLAAMCNGVAVMVNQIINRAGQHGVVKLLKIHSHGTGGSQNISAGRTNGAPHHAGISLSNFGAISSQLSRLTPYFSSDATVMLMGCSVAGDISGRQLIHKLSNLWSVNVIAGTNVQFSGAGDNTLVLEGRTLKASPGKKSLDSAGFPTFQQIMYMFFH